MRHSLGLFCLGLCFPSLAADSWALRFNGTNQYVQVPLGETIIMDDQGARCVIAPPGTWASVNVSSAFQGSARQSSEVQATVRWTPQLPRAGTYQVYAWWGGSPASLDSAAQYVVKHAGGLSTNVVDQQNNGGQWNLLGTFVFKANCEEFVSLRPSGFGVAVADAIRFVNEQAFDLTQSLTLEAWVKVAALDRPMQAIITKGDAWALNCFNDSFVFRTRDGSGAAHDLAGSQRFTTNRWYHLAATFDGVRKTLYVDEALAGSAIWQAALATNQSPVWFGGSAETPSSNYFRGDLDNIRIWSIARSQSDLQVCTNRNLRGTEAGLLGDWRFDDNARTNFMTLDSGAGALHGWLREPTSMPAQVMGFSFGSPLPGSLALRFNGYDQYVVLPDPPGRFDLADAGTIESWVYFDFPPDQRVTLVSKGASEGWELSLDPNGKLLFRTTGLLGPDPANPVSHVPAPDLYSSTRLDPGTWYHVAAVWDGAVGRKAIYLNGVLDSSATGMQGEITASAKAVHFAVSPADTGLQGYFGGVLDEVRLWSVARPGDKITENFGRDLNGTEPGLAGFWKFDEGSGLVAADKSPYSAKADGALSAGMSDLNRVAGRTLSPALLLQYCLSLDGETEYAQIEPASPFNLTDLTIEAWIKPTLGRDAVPVIPILRKGDNGYGLAVDQDGYLRFCSSNAVLQWPRSSRSLEVERDAQGNPILDAQNHPVAAWNHVAVVVNRSANTTTFYINGQPAGTHASSLVVNNSGPILLGGDRVSGSSYFQGLLDEVRLWNVPRSGVEVDLFAFTPLLGTLPPGLIGYWGFNEGTGTTLVDRCGAGHNGILINIDLENWRDGTDWGLPPLASGIGGLNPNPAAAGLWLGEVVLNKVNEVQAATQGAADLVTEAAHPASIRILLHVASDGQVRLLKDVIVMKRPSDTNAPPNVSTNPLPPVDLSVPATNLVLVTRSELIPDYEGVMKRGGKLVGLRYGTAAYDFDGVVLPLLGGVGPGAACMGRINLSKDHPTNPYRHKYHPDHRSGFDLVRQLTLLFDANPGDPWQEEPGYGVDRLTGIYRETVVGLHKIPLRVEGTVRLDRINYVDVLDDGR